MITFQYRAIGPDGKAVRGVVRAQDEMTAVQKIKETCPVITAINPVKEQTGSFLTMEISRKPKMKDGDLSILCSQFEIMLQAGMPVARCVSMIAEQTQNKKIAKILSEVAEDVSEGSTVASAFERNGNGVFPVTFTESIRAGEEAGTLEDTFTRMHHYYDKSAKNREKLQQAMTYPVFVLAVAAVVLIIVMAKVIPTLAQVFSSMDGQLPSLTRAMIAMSDFFSKWWILIILVILGAVIGFRVYFRTEKGAMAKGRLDMKLPVLGKIHVALGAAQFADTMSVMLGSGLTVNRAIEVTANVLNNAVLRDEVRKMRGMIEAGRSLKDCIRQVEEFPDTLRQMTGIGEETGDLDETLRVIGDYFDNEADHLTKQALNRLEPTILIFLAFFAGFIVISIYLPMFTMYNLF